MGILILEFLDSDTDEILPRALCVDITGRVLSARNCYIELVLIQAHMTQKPALRRALRAAHEILGEA
jgi:hypothetical protein